MAKATWNGKVIAESDTFEEVEGNVYFPRAALDEASFKESAHTSVCGWKGTASYFHIKVDGKTNENAAWSYKTPKDAAKNIAGYVAFWKGVTVQK